MKQQVTDKKIKTKHFDGVPCLLKLKYEPESQEPFYLVDYAHAGRDWKTQIAAWLPN